MLTLQQEFQFIEWSTGDTISNIVIHHPGFFAVTVSDGNECFGYDTIEVMSYPEIEVDITGDVTFCTQEEVVLGLAGEFSEYFWSVGSFNATILVNQPGWYFVTVTDDNGCMGSDSIFLEQLLPSVTQIHQEICAGETIEFNNQLLGEQGVYYDTLFAGAQNACDSLIVLSLEIIHPIVDTLIQSIEEGDSIYFNNEWLTESGVYSDSLIASVTFCDSIVFLDLEVYPYFAVYDTLEWTICSGEEIQFNGHIYSQTGQFRDTIYSNSALVPDTVFWINIEVVAPESGFVIYELCQGDSLFYEDLWHYEHKVFVDTLLTIDGCDSIVITELKFAELFVEITTAIPPLCFGDSSGVIEVDIVSSLSEYEILWNTGERQLLLEHLPAGEYQFTVTNTYGCIEEKFVSLSHPQQMKASLDTHLDCNNPGVAHFIVDHISGGTAPYLYSIEGQNFHTGNQLSAPAPGIYEPIIEDANGCHLQMAPVIVDSVLAIELDWTETYIHLGDSVQLSAFPNFVPVEILWSPANFLSCNDCLSPFAFPERTSTFSVAMQTIDGCWLENNLTVFVDQTVDVYAPTAFSPNGDGINDYFILFTGQGISEIQQLEIFDRWGNQVYRQHNLLPNDETAGWDGNFNGKPMDQGVFVYTTVVKKQSGDLLEFHGEFLLLRE
jgi:gliding motility-associated-like protein